MLPLLVRLPTMRLGSSTTLQVLKRTQTISINQRASNRQQQALIRGGVALVAIGGAGYLLNKILNSPAVMVPSSVTGVQTCALPILE